MELENCGGDDEKCPSPGVGGLVPSQVLLRRGIESYLRFSSSSLPCCFPDQVIHGLLDETHSEEQLGFEEGVPSHPLYKELASSLHKWITTSVFPRPFHTIPGLSEDTALCSKIAQSSDQIVEHGNRLIKSLQCTKFFLEVQEPFFSFLKDGSKSIEGRCAVGRYMSISNGDFILANDILLLEVMHVKVYASFKALLEAEGLEKVLPGVAAVEEGVMIYRRFYSEEKEKIGGALAIHVCKVSDENQPWNIISNMLSELQLDGIRSMIGLRSTAGTVSTLLPPARSVLLSSFTAPYSENVVGSTLSVGARALSKHFHRSSSGWWGSLSGPDASKNNHAVLVINEMLKHATWMNTHYVSPDNIVFEIRNKEGYGARWSVDGTQFRGFLEPQMSDGHLKKWRH